MSKEEFETYLALVGSLLQLTPEQREQISDELYDHLENRVADLEQDGLERDAAIAQAVEEFGDASALATNLKNVTYENRKRWMMRFATLCTAAAFLVGIFTMAMWPQQARFGAPASSIAQNDADPFGGADPFANSKASVAKEKPSTMTGEMIREKLKTACELSYDETSFFEVKEDLEGKLGINIVLTRSASDDGLTEDEVFTSNLSGISCADALRIILAEKNATYSVQNGVLKFISLDEVNDARWLVRSMIDVSESLAMIREFEADRIGKPSVVISGGSAGGSFGGGGGAGGSGGGVFAIQGAAPAEQNAAPSEVKMLADAILQALNKSNQSVVVPTVTAESMLLGAIQDSVAMDNWVDNGGEASITCVGGILIVNASEQVSEKVASFMADLNAKLKAKKGK